MVFASLPFLFLILPFFLVSDVVLRVLGAARLRNLALLTISLLFYTWGEAYSVFLLSGLGVFNYLAGRLLGTGLKPKLLLLAAVTINLGVLVGFKYAYWLLSFFIPAFSLKSGAIPLGISFFTFHAISYLVDVYRKQILPARTALDFLTYFCMFPHLIAGPIVRYAHVQQDLESRGPDRDLFSFGMYRFLVGLNKKVIIANTVSLMADSAFQMSALGKLGSADAWLGVAAYAVQIYFDFSGYSDMAIGLAAMAGFHFEENFKRPYSSASIREFWRRWHISLSSWLKDYLYIPLGGSRKGELTTYRNMLLVFFLCGLWHGADLTFILWGLWHGLFLVLERIGLGRFLDRLPRFLSRGYMFAVVVIGWVFFRADSTAEAWTYLKRMFVFSSDPVVLTYHVGAFAALAAGALLCLLPDSWLPAPASRSPRGFSHSAYLCQAALGALSMVLLFAQTRNPFIYFNF